MILSIFPTIHPSDSNLTNLTPLKSPTSKMSRIFDFGLKEMVVTLHVVSTHETTSRVRSIHMERIDFKTDKLGPEWIFIQNPVKSNYKVRPGDVITLMLDRPHYDTTIEPEDIPLDVVYEDDQLMVINKPAGLVVHPGVGNFHGTLVNAIAWHLRNLPSYDPNDPSVGLVHRIDKDTSGLLVVAKTPEAKTELGAQFFNHDTHRSYQALVWGNFAEDQGRIEGNIGRDPKDRQRMAVFPPGSDIGKTAVTHYKVLERFGYTTLVECRLETGRTHQIRAHMKHIGHPLFADERYGGMEILRGERTASYKAYIQNCFKLCNRQALHAKTLGFVHPVTHEQMDFTSKLAADMAALLDKWRARTP